MYARVTNIRFPPEMKAEVSRVVQGLAPILRRQRGFEGQMSMMSSFLHEPLVPKTYEVSVKT